MKKHIIILIVALSFGMNLYAQNDGFFKSSYTEYREENGEDFAYVFTAFHFSKAIL